MEWDGLGWLPVQAGCQIIIILATSPSWLPGDDAAMFLLFLAYQQKLASRSRWFWLPAQAGCHVSGYQCKLIARSSCFWLPAQAGCQVTMFLATRISWLPGHRVAGYQCKLTARSSYFWLPAQAGCQVTMFLATSTIWLPGHHVSGYQCKLPREGGCVVVVVFWLLFGSTVAKVAEA